MEPVVVYGGTFDPVHIGHLRSALEVHEYLSPCRLYLVPSNCPPHRVPTLFSAAARLLMLNIAADRESKLIVDSRECQREGPSYTVDTLASFRKEIGSEVPLLLVLGMDAYRDLHRWHQWERINEYASLVLMDRPGFDLESLDPQLQLMLGERLTEDTNILRTTASGVIHKVSLTQLQISATRIREMIREHRSVRYLVPDGVYEFIKGHNLYAD